MDKEKINLRLIIDGCREGNRQSQRKLYEHFFAYGMGIALRYSKNQHEAEEIFNDAFLKVFFNLDKYDPNFPFKSWFRRLLVNTAIDYLRKYQKYNLNYTNELPPEPIDHSDSTPLIDDETDALPILQNLSPAYRVVFNLYVMEEYKHHEIAEILDISVGTSKSNLARAKAKLKLLLQQQKAAASKTNEHG